MDSCFFLQQEGSFFCSKPYVFIDRKKTAIFVPGNSSLKAVINEMFSYTFE